MSAGIIHFPQIEGLTRVDFLSSGTFQVPNGITNIFVLGIGGGQSGGQVGVPDPLGGTNTVGAGGSSGVMAFLPMIVVPNTNVNITIGVGGAGSNSSTFNSGGNTIVSGTLQTVIFRGGNGGAKFYSPGGSSTAGGVPSGFTNPGQASDSMYGSGGGNRGGGAGYGNGATPGNDASANTGSGGGGNDGGGSGSGGSGRVQIYYSTNN